VIYITLNNSIYSESTTTIKDVAIPLKVHKVIKNNKKVNMGLITESEALINMVLKGHKDSIKNTFSSGSKNGLIFASGNTIWSGSDLKLIKKPKDYPPCRVLPMSMANILIGKVANSLGKFNHISTDSTACISGHMAIKMAKLLIDSGELDRVLIISADNGTSYDLIEFFTTAGACTTLATEGTEHESFRLGQGANFLVLENWDSIKETNNMPEAELLSVQVASENYTNPLGIDGSGEGYRRVISKSPSNQEYVKLHGTGTKDNEIEEKIVNEYISDYIPLKYKDRIGHTLGSNSNIELCIAINENQGSILSLSAGMGNVFSAVSVFSL
jgi:3-oxoacyl-(acyl-carrier-protein) synthase